MTQLDKKDTLLTHGTCVDIKGSGVLIRGNPGMGKSSLALQLMDRGALLVSDDQTILSLETGQVVAGPPSSLKGMMEVRGIGLCTFPFQQKSYLKLCVEICEKRELERLPETLFIEYHQVKIPLLKLEKNELLGAIKVEVKLFRKE
ncbi:MAG: serine/threonine protein kinase [Alphaproteobacteria bacterium]|nr:serine/threonine protein kinase [Alphaproteobacteria bacterium]